MKKTTKTLKDSLEQAIKKLDLPFIVIVYRYCSGVEKVFVSVGDGRIIDNEAILQAESFITEI